jgi:hypothetical protein
LQTLAKDRIERDGYFEWSGVNALIQDHLIGKNNNRKPLFALLMLHLWMDRYL